HPEHCAYPRRRPHSHRLRCDRTAADRDRRERLRPESSRATPSTGLAPLEQRVCSTGAVRTRVRREWGLPCSVFRIRIANVECRMIAVKQAVRAETCLAAGLYTS